MRILLVLALAVAAATASVLPSQTESVSPPTEDISNDYVLDLADRDVELELDVANEADSDALRALILSWELRRLLRKAKKQMPCGWPEYGIPPLAPLKLRETEVSFKTDIIETIDKIFHMRIDGLDDFTIKKFKVHTVASKVQFDFIFPNIKVSIAKLDTNTTLDVMRQLGLLVHYEGEGSLEFGFVSLRVAGTLKYKLPIFWGHAKITSLKTEITVKKFTSDITGFLGKESINRAINHLIENFVEKKINTNTKEISNLIEQTLVPRVNQQLKGQDFWTVLAYIISIAKNENDPNSKCVPPVDPWA